MLGKYWLIKTVQGLCFPPSLFPSKGMKPVLLTIWPMNCCIVHLYLQNTSNYQDPQKKMLVIIVIFECHISWDFICICHCWCVAVLNTDHNVLLTNFCLELSLAQWQWKQTSNRGAQINFVRDPKITPKASFKRFNGNFPIFCYHNIHEISIVFMQL